MIILINFTILLTFSDLIGVETRYRAEPSDGSPGFLNNVLKQPGPNPPLQWSLLTPGTGDRGCPYPEIRKDVDVGCTCSEEALSVSLHIRLFHYYCRSNL